MKLKYFHEIMTYDEFGKKDYQGYIFLIIMAILTTITIYLAAYLSKLKMIT